MADKFDRDALNYYTGTEQWYRYSPLLFPSMLLTDGTKYVADSAGAYWLMDAIASHILHKPEVRSESFVLCRLEVSAGKAMLTLDDGDGTILAEQAIDSTDFPAPGIMLYAINDGKYWTLLLPSEY